MPPPAAPKPGVIPLAPLSLGDIFGGIFTTMGRHWKQLFGIAGLMYGGALLVVGVALAVAYSATSDTLDTVFDAGRYAESFDSGDAWSLGISFGAVWIVAILAMIVATAAVQAACPAVLQDAVLGRRTTIGAVWRRTRPRLLAVIGTMLLPWLAAALVMAVFMASYIFLIVAVLSSDASPGWAVLGFLLVFALMPVGIWVWVLFSLAPAAVVFESQRPVAALRRSAQLVKGSWWRIFGISLLAYLAATVVGYIIQFPLTIIGMMTSMPGITSMGPEPTFQETLAATGSYMAFILVGSVITQIIAAILPQLATSLLYVDQRMRKENLAPVLTEAAAAQG